MNFFVTSKKMVASIKILGLIFIAGLLIVALAAVFNIIRMNARDAARVTNIATVKLALAKYLNDSPTGYPASTGECLSLSTGVGSALKTQKVILSVPVDPLWPTAAPAHTNGVPDSGQTNFCYFYYSDDSNNFKLSFFLEANSRAGHAGINTATQ